VGRGAGRSTGTWGVVVRYGGAGPEWWVAVQVRRKGAVVAEEQFSSLGSFSELQRVAASAKGVEFKEREVNPNCGGMGTRYTETIRSHLVRFDGSRLADVARTVSSSSGRCN